VLHGGSLTDVAGLSVGHATRADRPTGCTVVLCPQAVVCGVDVRGGAPGTRETDLLRSENTVDRVHAVLLTGGSAFGLDAAGGVMRWLDERGHGLAVGPARVPIVPAAVLFDLWLGDPRLRPDAALGFAACNAAHAGAVECGSVGAGAGATVGKLFGIERAMKAGIGSASLRVGAFTMAALVAVNALGDVVEADGQLIAGARGADGRLPCGARDRLLAGDAAMRVMAGMATTIGVVATEFEVEGRAWPIHDKALVLLHKPAGYECSQKPRHHPSVMSLLPAPLRDARRAAGGPARRGHHRAAAAHRRRRPHPPADLAEAPRAQGLRGDGAPRAGRPTSCSACATAWCSTTTRRRCAPRRPRPPARQHAAPGADRRQVPPGQAHAGRGGQPLSTRCTAAPSAR
jgi:L-aminopeptidase/D-esterase-like protein